MCIITKNGLYSKQNTIDFYSLIVYNVSGSQIQFLKERWCLHEKTAGPQKNKCCNDVTCLNHDWKNVGREKKEPAPQFFGLKKTSFSYRCCNRPMLLFVKIQIKRCKKCNLTTKNWVDNMVVCPCCNRALQQKKVLLSEQSRLRKTPFFKSGVFLFFTFIYQYSSIASLSGLHKKLTSFGPKAIETF